MHLFRSLTLLLIPLTILFFTYCTSPTKSKKKVQEVIIDNIEISDEVDNNENGYSSSVRVNFSVRVTTGELEVHIAMGLYREDDNELVGGGLLEWVDITESRNNFYFDISNFPQDTYWIALIAFDPEDEENIYATVTPEDEFELGNLDLELLSQDAGGFYVRFNNYTFAEIDLTVEGEY